MAELRVHDKQSEHFKSIRSKEAKQNIDLLLPEKSGTILTDQTVIDLLEGDTDLLGFLIYKPDISVVSQPSSIENRDGHRIKTAPYRTNETFVGVHERTEWIAALDPNMKTVLDHDAGYLNKTEWFPSIQNVRPFWNARFPITLYIKYRFMSQNIVSPWSDVFSIHIGRSYFCKPDLNIFDTRDTETEKDNTFRYSQTAIVVEIKDNRLEWVTDSAGRIRSEYKSPINYAKFKVKEYKTGTLIHQIDKYNSNSEEVPVDKFKAGTTYEFTVQAKAVIPGTWVNNVPLSPPRTQLFTTAETFVTKPSVRLEKTSDGIFYLKSSNFQYTGKYTKHVKTQWIIRLMRNVSSSNQYQEDDMYNELSTENLTILDITSMVRPTGPDMYLLVQCRHIGINGEFSPLSFDKVYPNRHYPVVPSMLPKNEITSKFDPALTAISDGSNYFTIGTNSFHMDSDERFLYYTITLRNVETNMVTFSLCHKTDENGVFVNNDDPKGGWYPNIYNTTEYKLMHVQTGHLKLRLYLKMSFRQFSLLTWNWWSGNPQIGRIVNPPIGRLDKMPSLEYRWHSNGAFFITQLPGVKFSDMVWLDEFTTSKYTAKCKVVTTKKELNFIGNTAYLPAYTTDRNDLRIGKPSIGNSDRLQPTIYKAPISGYLFDHSLIYPNGPDWLTGCVLILKTLVSIKENTTGRYIVSNKVINEVSNSLDGARRGLDYRGLSGYTVTEKLKPDTEYTAYWTYYIMPRKITREVVWRTPKFSIMDPSVITPYYNKFIVDNKRAYYLFYVTGFSYRNYYGNDSEIKFFYLNYECPFSNGYTARGVKKIPIEDAWKTFNLKIYHPEDLLEITHPLTVGPVKATFSLFEPGHPEYTSPPSRSTHTIQSFHAEYISSLKVYNANPEEASKLLSARALEHHQPAGVTKLQPKLLQYHGPATDPIPSNNIKLEYRIGIVDVLQRTKYYNEVTAKLNASWQVEHNSLWVKLHYKELLETPIGVPNMTNYVTAIDPGNGFNLPNTLRKIVNYEAGMSVYKYNKIVGYYDRELASKPANDGTVLLSYGSELHTNSDYSFTIQPLLSPTPIVKRSDIYKRVIPAVGNRGIGKPEYSVYHTTTNNNLYIECKSRDPIGTLLDYFTIYRINLVINGIKYNEINTTHFTTVMRGDTRFDQHQHILQKLTFVIDRSDTYVSTLENANVEIEIDYIELTGPANGFKTYGIRIPSETIKYPSIR